MGFLNRIWENLDVWDREENRKQNKKAHPKYEKRREGRRLAKQQRDKN